MEVLHCARRSTAFQRGCGWTGSLWKHVTQPERAFEGSPHPRVLKIYEVISHPVLEGIHPKHESVAFLN